MSATLAEFSTAGDGDNTLLFLHGLGGDKTNWRPQVEEFSRTHRCIAWTLPGYGDSPALSELSWPATAQAAVQVLDSVGVDTATVVGLSMGGYVAQQLAADHPDRVDGLVLAATTAQFGRGSATFAEKFLSARLAPIRQGMTPADLAPNVVPNLVSADAPPETIANCIASMSRISADAYERALGLLVTWDLTARLHEIAAPALCLAGEHDRTAPPEAVRALADALPRARFEVVAESNHLINLDRASAFNQAVQRFLSSNAG